MTYWKSRIAGLMLALALTIPGAALGNAEILTLPKGLTEISEEVFLGDEALTEVEIPEGVLHIGPRAFWGCTNLERIIVPGSVAHLGDQAMADCAEDLLIRTVPDSAALAYARANSIDYQAQTVYRALLIGQCYADDPQRRLEGPENDIAALSPCLEAFENTPYQVNVRQDLEAQGILDAIDEVFGPATAEDVSLLYYSGHGVFADAEKTIGALLGADGEDCVTADQLRAALDHIPGRKIVILDACYSGSFITTNALRSAGDDSPEVLTSALLRPFSALLRKGLSADGYFVMTAAAANEETYETLIHDRVMGLFTARLVQGCEGSEDDPLPADANGNGVITFQELFQYISASVSKPWQHVQVYPTNCTWFGLLRK